MQWKINFDFRNKTFGFKNKFIIEGVKEITNILKSPIKVSKSRQ